MFPFSCLLLCSLSNDSLNMTCLSWSGHVCNLHDFEWMIEADSFYFYIDGDALIVSNMDRPVSKRWDDHVTTSPNNLFSMKNTAWRLQLLLKEMPSLIIYAPFPYISLLYLLYLSANCPDIYSLSYLAPLKVIIYLDELINKPLSGKFICYWLLHVMFLCYK